MIGTIWDIDEAKQRHVHSPGLANWLAYYLDKQLPVVDVGCGLGLYIATLDDFGFTTIGYEGTPGIGTIAKGNVHQADITEMLPRDMVGNVLCLEVMEHIEPKNESRVLANIKHLCTKTLVLSWAIEGQNGYGHINCKNAEYVVPTIEALGFKIDFAVTMRAREHATRMPHTNFFNQSLYIFNKL